MRESVQHSACLHSLALEIGLLEAPAGGSRHNVFIEGERNKYNSDEKIDNCADGTHRFGADLNINTIPSYFQDIRKSSTYIASFLILLISTPFNPALINVSPSHRIRPYVNANAIPLNANEAISGSPSPRKLLTKMADEAAKNDRRLHFSALERVEAMMFYVEDMIFEIGNFHRRCMKTDFWNGGRSGSSRLRVS